MEGKIEGAVSCLTFFEIERLALKGAVEKEAVGPIIASISGTCRVVWIDSVKLLTSSARTSHTFGISGMDAIIIESLILAGARTVYTTDSDFQKYKKPHIKIINLSL